MCSTILSEKKYFLVLMNYSMESSSTDAIVDTNVETTLATTPNIITKRPPPSKKNISASIVYFLSHRYCGTFILTRETAKNNLGGLFYGYD